MPICQKNCENTSKFRPIVLNAVGIQIFKKTNVPSILHAHKTQWDQNISEAEFSVLCTYVNSIS